MDANSEERDGGGGLGSFCATAFLPPTIISAFDQGGEEEGRGDGVSKRGLRWGISHGFLEMRIRNVGKKMPCKRNGT